MGRTETIHADAGRVTMEWTDEGLEVSQHSIHGTVTILLDPDSFEDMTDAMLEFRAAWVVQKKMAAPA